jgi:hypothetical protein
VAIALAIIGCWAAVFVRAMRMDLGAAAAAASRGGWAGAAAAADVALTFAALEYLYTG